jgi:hypothetical protein
MPVLEEEHLREVGLEEFIKSWVGCGLRERRGEDVLGRGNSFRLH